MPDFASTTTPMGSIACFSGPSASRAAAGRPPAVPFPRGTGRARVTPGERARPGRVKRERARREHGTECFRAGVARGADARDERLLLHIIPFLDPLCAGRSWPIGAADTETA